MSGEKKICLYCRKEISSENPIELKNLWHPKCIQKFFGTVDFPEISVTKEQLENLALETVSKGYTVAGVQKKLSLHLSQAYDLLPVNLAMPEDTEDFALTMNGKKSKIKRHDFLTFADTCKISESAAEKIIHKIISLEGMFKKLVAESFLSESEKSDFIKLIASRMERLRK